jgi:hypothetical protein
MGMYGDPATISTLATALQGSAGAVSKSSSDAGWAVALMVPSGWSGTAANAFVTQWNGEQAQMSQLSMASATMAGTLNRLATALTQANQVAAQGAVAQALSTGGYGAAASANAYAMAKAAWAQATTELSAVTVPAIGPMTSPQQAQAWASSTQTPVPVMTSTTFLDTTGTNNPWQNKKPPFPPLFPSTNTGNVTLQNGQQQPVVVPGLFPGGGLLTLQGSLNPNGSIAIGGNGKAVGGTSGIDWKALLAALAAAGALGGATALATSNRAKRWQEILAGIALGGRLLGGAHDPNATADPLHQLLDKIGGVAAPTQKAPGQKPPGQNNAGGDGGPPDDGQWHKMPDGSLEKRLPDGSILKVTPGSP